MNLEPGMVFITQNREYLILEVDSLNVTYELCGKKFTISRSK